MEKLRIGIVGAGEIAVNRHIPALNLLHKRVMIMAICDIDIQKANRVATKFQIPFVSTDYKELLTKVDAIIICTPNKFHSEIAVFALQANVHVFCEKPMALSKKECHAMLSTAHLTKKILTIGYHYRFMKEAQGAKKLLDSGIIGKPLVVRVQALRRRMMPNWGVFTNKELQGGGSLMDYGCHLLDLALWLIGSKVPLEIVGKTYNSLGKSKNQVNQWGPFDHTTFDVDDHVTAYITFENGLSLLLETSWLNNIEEEVIETVSISGDLGGISVFPLVMNYSKEGMLFNSEAVWIPGSEEPGIAQMKNFIEACLGNEELIVKPEEALLVSGIIEKIYESSEVQHAVQY